MNIPYQDLAGTHQIIYRELEEVFKEVLRNEWYIRGRNCEAFDGV